MKIIILIILFTSVAFSAWYGILLSPKELHMSNKEAGVYYGFVGIVCAYAFVHHFRSF